jgi:hypothetical protein
MHGILVSEKKDIVSLDQQSVNLLSKIILPGDNGEVFFLKLQLTEGDKIIDENIYWLSNKAHSYEKLTELKKVNVTAAVKKNDGDRTVIEISNPTDETAFFIRLKVINEKDELVLPVFMTDNYFTLFPGEAKQIGLDAGGIKKDPSLSGLRLAVEGWNVVQGEIKF